ncbi:MAG: recombination regulator RecX [Betaproteobacteria bacterium]|jgi:regulatory protein|nr:recombination regulator RecX [Betaproteobacteria bacterium]
MSKPNLRERALRCLSRRDYSRAELATKLAPYGTDEEIETVLNRMGELSLQSDARMAENWVRTHAGRFGRVRLRHELTRRGLARELIEEALANGDMASELERARAVWQSRYSALPLDAREWTRQTRFLLARGFATDTVRAVLHGTPEENEEDGAS